MMDFTIILTIFMGLALFLFGIEHLSREIKRAIGEKFRKILEKSTKTRVRGAFLGAGFTAIIQSAVATIVITTGLVNAGILSFTQSLGIIIGSNVGTTLTAQLVAFNVMAFAPIFLILGFLISMFGKNNYKILGKSIFYFGLVFFSLNLMSEALIPIQNNPIVMNWLSQLSNVFLALLVGFLITAVVQSSSVTTGLVVVLASSGMITLPQSIPLLLGANIGSTLPVLITSFKLNLYAKRTAIAQLLFNLLGALILIPFIIPFSNLVISLGGSMGQQTANAHTIFNLGFAIIFLIALKPFKYLIEKIVPGKEKEILQKTKYLSEKKLKENTLGISLIEKEIIYSLKIISHMVKKSNLLLINPSNKELDRLERYNSLTILLNKEIEKSLFKISKKKLSLKESKQVVNLIRISNSINQLGDSLNNLGHLYYKLEELKNPINKKSKKDVTELTKLLKNIIKMTGKLLLKKGFILKRKIIHKRIEKNINKKYQEYFFRLKKGKEFTEKFFVEPVSIMETGFIKIQEIIDLIIEYKKIR